MATVEVSFTALPAHVRTARLVATAVARRSGVAESLIDEVRLAVGEACTRAVEAHRLHCPGEPVRIALSDQSGRFEIRVTDTGAAPGRGEPPPRPHATGTGEPAGHPDPLGVVGALPAAEAFPLAVIAGLADQVKISETASGTSITMSWPVAPGRP